MSSPLTLAFDTISAAFILLAPPDRAESTYHEAGGTAAKSGVAGDREFYFDLPVLVDVPGIKDINAAQVQWQFDVFVRLSAAGRNMTDMSKAACNEMVLLTRTVQRIESWPAKVCYCQIVGTDAVRDDETGDVVLILNFDALTEEND